MSPAVNRLAVAPSMTMRNRFHGDKPETRKMNRYAVGPAATALTAPVWRNPALAVTEAKSVARRRSVAIVPTALAVIIFGLIVGGGAGSYLAPGSPLELGVPAGFTLWALLAWRLRRDGE